MYLRTAATALALLLTSLPALSQDMVSAADPDSIIQVLQDLGYRAQMDASDSGDPLIRSAADGTNFRIWFYGCDGNSGCTGLNFSAGFDLAKGTTYEAIDSWNDGQLLGYANLDDEKDPFLNYFVVTNGGISKEAFESVLARWELAIVDFKKHIGFE
jgi:Putative bacterial sensory transduction regulator